MKIIIVSGCTLAALLALRGWQVPVVRADERLPVEKVQVLAEIESLSKLSPKDRAATVGLIAQHRVLCKEKLLGQLGGEAPSNHDRCSVIFLLGYYRLEDAAPALAKMITFESDDKGLRDQKLPLWGRYPAAEALTRIGSPATSAVLEQIQNSADDLTLSLGAQVISGVYTAKVAECVFDEAIAAQAQNPLKRKRLEQAKAALKRK